MSQIINSTSVTDPLIEPESPIVEEPMTLGEVWDRMVKGEKFPMAKEKELNIFTVRFKDGNGHDEEEVEAHHYQVGSEGFIRFYNDRKVVFLLAIKELIYIKEEEN